VIRAGLSAVAASMATAIIRADERAEYSARPLIVQRWGLEDGLWGWVEELRCSHGAWRPQYAFHGTAYRIVEVASGQMLEHWGSEIVVGLASWKMPDSTLPLEQRCYAVERGVLGYNVGRSQASAAKYARGLMQRFRACAWSHPKAFDALMACIDLLESEPGAATLEA
jgi:hypothetical protein